MDRPILVDSRGGIVTPATPYHGSHYAPSIQEWSPDVAAYIETVMIPSVTASPTAIFDGRPDDLLRVTYTSGAALTFFVDSVAGGNDASGNGSYDNPWRSLKTASKFIQCAECILNTACQYIQIKVKGTVDYVSGSWNPKSYHSKTLILTGWDGVCDLGSSGVYHAGYIRDCKAKSYYYGATVHSGGFVYSAGPSATAIHAAIPSGGTDYFSMTAFSMALGCSGGGVSAQYASGGLFQYASVGQAVSIRVSRHLESGGSISAWGLLVGSAAYRASVFVSADASQTARVDGIIGNGAALINCTVTAVASASGSGRGATAVARAATTPLVVSGGAFAAHATARGEHGSYNSCYAYADGIEITAGGAVRNAATDLSAVARATVTAPTGSAQCIEDETVANLGTSCYIRRVRYYSAGVMCSSHTSSSGVC